MRNMYSKKKLTIIILSITLCMAISISNIPKSLAQQEEKYFFTLHAHHERMSEFHEILKAELAKIGINVELEVVDLSARWDRRWEGGETGATFEEGGYDMMDFWWGPWSADPSYMVYMFTTDARSPSGDNTMNWFNGELDNALEMGASLADWEDREPYYFKAAEILYDEMPFVPLNFPIQGYVIRSDFIYCDPFATDGTGSPVKTTNWGDKPTVSPSNWYYWDTRLVAREGKTYEDDTTSVFMIPGDVDMLNPLLGGSAGRPVHYSMYDSLLWPRNQYLEEGEWRGNLAESWDVSDDGMTFTFHLRTDVKWHDGVPFTSADVIGTLDAINDPDTGIRGIEEFQETVASYEAPDDYTVVIKLTWADPNIWYTTFQTMILPNHVWGEIPHADWLTSDYNAGLEIPPGTGPYKLVRWVRGDHVEMEKYEDYHLFPLFFDNTYFKVYPDREISILAVQAGECDVAQADWQHIDIAKEDSELDYSYSRPWSLFLLMFNVENPYLNNKWVRQAISVAFPRQHYSDDVRHGLWDTANQFLSPTLPGHNPDLPEIPYDIDLAKSYMEKAGYNYEWLEPDPVPENLPTPMLTILTYAGAGLVIGVLVAYVLLRQQKP